MWIMAFENEVDLAAADELGDILSSFRMQALYGAPVGHTLGSLGSSRATLMPSSAK